MPLSLSQTITATAFVFLVFGLNIRLSAQISEEKKPDLDALIQSIAAVQDEDLDYSALYESLYQLYTNPIDLNKARKEDLQALYLLNEKQIQNLFAHIEKYGKLISIYELQAIEGFDYQTIQRILPFVQITERADNRNLLTRIWNEPKRGYVADSLGNTPYLGSPDKMYVRFRVSHQRDFSLGFTLEKDAGEAMTWNPDKKQYGFDFQSFHAALYDKGRWKALILGDYQLQFGQGLITAGGFGIGKGSETINTVKRSHWGILPYTSAVESAFLRGLAATYSLSKNWEATFFASYRAQDALLRNFEGDTLSDQDEYASSIRVIGYHRTIRELAGKSTLNEGTYGTNVCYLNAQKNAKIGFTFMQNKFSNPIFRTNRYYNQFEFQGSLNYNLGLHYEWTWQNFNFFGEGAVSASGGKGFLGGLLVNLSDLWQMSMLLRQYDRNFHTFYGNAFSENSRSINESGIYWGIKYQSPNRKWLLTAYYDRFRFPWLKFLVDAPSEGYEWLGRLTYQPSKTVQLYVQFREESKARNLRDNPASIDFPVESVKRNGQITLTASMPHKILLRSRIQFSSYQQVNRSMTSGYAMVQDLEWDRPRWDLNVRFAIFDTDDYDNRQYMYEKDVLYAFAMPIYYGRGFRNYWLFSWKLNKNWAFWLKYTYTQYPKQDYVDSALEQIKGNSTQEIKMQLRYKF
jgi:Helix-hairpin-helix motif